MRTVLKILIGILVGFVLAGVLLLLSRRPTGTVIPLVPPPTESPIVVHVVGAVPRPGVYEFPKKARVRDAIDAAGGLLTDADITFLNLAAPLEDGQQLEIPYVGGTPIAPAATAAPVTGVPPNADLVNINTATLEQLDALPGIGPTFAQRIVDYRTEHGPFQSINDLMNVAGIGPTTFEKIKNLITV